jgi:hypothetical protein
MKLHQLESLLTQSVRNLKEAKKRNGLQNCWLGKLKRSTKVRGNARLHSRFAKSLESKGNFKTAWKHGTF